MKKVSKKNCWRPRLGSGYLKQSPIQSNLSKSTPNLLRIPGSNQSKLVLWVPLPSTVSDFFFFLLPRKKNACHRASFNRGTRRSKLQSQSKSGRGTAMTESMPWIWWMDRRSEARMNEWMNDPEWWMRATVFLFHFFSFFSFFFFALIDRVSDGCNFRVLGVDHISILFVIDINEHRKIQQTNFQSSIEIKVSFPNRNSRQIDFRVHVKYGPVNK